jgi:hypothetical protein
VLQLTICRNLAFVFSAGGPRAIQVGMMRAVAESASARLSHRQFRRRGQRRVHGTGFTEAGSTNFQKSGAGSNALDVSGNFGLRKIASILSERMACLA